MKRTLIPEIRDTLPAFAKRFVDGATLYDSSCSPEARVYFLDRDGGFYLKRAGRGSLERECAVTRYYHSIGLGTEVLEYATLGEFDWLLTRAVRGEDCTHSSYLSEPERLAKLIGSSLRALHELDASSCPVQNKMQEYVALAEENYRTGNYDSSHFPDSFGYRSAEDAIAVLREGKHLFASDTLLHGDYCLPNIMLDDWRLSGFIDLGAGGVGDRHVDLFWGAWTLGFNLGTDKYRDLFFDAYGRDKIDPDLLDVVAAAEVFG
ncbi:MAG: aminoglycoside 3'-phosphotransferase [Clostridia bacterium]|nr:aminoglycoside 3'-phosphotransferase [Clostridia bacterium]